MRSLEKRLFMLLHEQLEEHTLMSFVKLQALYYLLCSIENFEGDVAECGVYKGGSLKLIAKMLPNKDVYGFDTFSGLGTPEEFEKHFKKGRFKADFEEVKAYLSDCPNVTLFKGWFPKTAKPIEDKKFSFVHLDMDQYKPTLEGLKFFYPRMEEGGIIVSDDYHHPKASGIEKAFEEFFKDKPEKLYECGNHQVYIIKQ